MTNVSHAWVIDVDGTDVLVDYSNEGRTAHVVFSDDAGRHSFTLTAERHYRYTEIDAPTLARGAVASAGQGPRVSRIWKRRVGGRGFAVQWSRCRPAYRLPRVRGSWADRRIAAAWGLHAVAFETWSEVDQ